MKKGQLSGSKRGPGRGVDPKSSQSSKKARNTSTAILYSEINPFSTKQSKLTELKDWLSQNNCKGIDTLEFDVSDGCDHTVGCFAKKNFKTGDLLFSISKQCTIGYHLVAESHVVQFFIQAILEKYHSLDRITQEFLFWLYLIEQKDKSLFGIYLQSLSDLSPNLLHWDSDLLAILQNTNLAMTIQDLNSRLHHYVQLIDDLHLSHSTKSETLLPKTQYNYTSLLWACGHYLSRRYPDRFAAIHSNPNTSSTSTSTTSSTVLVFSSLSHEKGFGNIGSIIPCLDILNHDHTHDYLQFQVEVGTTTSTSTSNNDSSSSLSVYCNHPIVAGHEMFSNYGKLSNGQLLFAYGYAIENNPYDELLLKIKLPDSIILPTATAATSSSVAVSGGGENRGLFAIQRGGWNGIPKVLIIYLYTIIIIIIIIICYTFDYLLYILSIILYI
jgi:hypothetical protein